MLKKIVFATNNSHKLEELRRLTKGKIEILSLSDINCHDNIPETADTLEGNALIKARWVKERYGYDCFADDTGLEVDALDGAPGVLSARYAGEGHDSQANMRLLLSNLGDNTNRKARFRTVIALIEGKEERLMDGVVEGEITQSPSGENGFGYDPIFKPMGFNVTFAEMGADEKNQISHRGRAVAKLLEYFSL
ncbi:MAG: non-canonical purine NTP diphosphatase [Muribaculaceae bacterium]|nr:non-canonical purine NTP diphosphatase [Muribaculaceae bacterium]